MNQVADFEIIHLHQARKAPTRGTPVAADSRPYQHAGTVFALDPGDGGRPLRDPMDHDGK
jgi:hypothetical protein